MNDFTYILLSVWYAWCQVFVSGKLIYTCMLYPLVFNCRGGAGPPRGLGGPRANAKSEAPQNGLCKGILGTRPQELLRLYML